MNPKDLAKAFYDSDLANDSKVVSKYFHPECELHWTGSNGFMLLDYNGVQNFFDGIRQAYNNLRFEFSHFLSSDNHVFTRHTLYGTTVENDETEQALGHFSAIWEVKDNKLYRCYEMSQQVDESNSQSMQSFQEIKV